MKRLLPSQDLPLKVRFGQNKTIYQKQKDSVGSVYGVKNAMERKQILAIKFLLKRKCSTFEIIKK